ncbi:MAG: hypothetical protein D6773_12135 [Alphaproteobacteria bacterium]|nr:MAG: hypothetical protein D6773_12135 [Alphaproteobacteria bacterium]
MPKDRVRANNPALPGVTRRAALAAPLVLLPRNTFARTESPILRLFHEYERLRPALEAAGDEAEADRLYDRMSVLEAEMMALPSVTAADFAAKTIRDSCRGVMFSDWETGGLWIEARALTGCGV